MKLEWIEGFIGGIIIMMLGFAAFAEAFLSTLLVTIRITTRLCGFMIGVLICTFLLITSMSISIGTIGFLLIQYAGLLQNPPEN